MELRTVCALSLIALLTAACDEVQQKKPETAAGVIAASPSPAEPAASEAATIRFFGPGVDHPGQTRI